MAINEYTLHMLKNWAARKPAGARIASLGYPDMLVPVARVREILQVPNDVGLPIRADSESILAWHGLLDHPAYDKKVVDAGWVLQKLGLQATYVDVHEVRGGEIRQDLNQKLNPLLFEQFDIVYDAGTLEHCFNIAQAIENVLAMAKVGGFIYHGNPHNVGNHGFFNLTPTFYHDFYTQNGHDLVPPGCEVIHNGEPQGVLPSVGRYHLTFGVETWIMACAVKKHDTPPHWPTQTKYITNPNLAGDKLH